MKRYVKLFEDFSEEQNDFLHEIGKRMGLHGHSDALELILDYAAKNLHTVPENILVNKISKDELLTIKEKLREGGMIDLESFGVKTNGGISRLSHGEIMTIEQFRELSDEIRKENPELFKENGHLKNQRVFGVWMSIRNKKAQKYGVVLATGPAGIFLLRTKTS